MARFFAVLVAAYRRTSSAFDIGDFLRVERFLYRRARGSRRNRSLFQGYDEMFGKHDGVAAGVKKTGSGRIIRGPVGVADPQRLVLGRVLARGAGDDEDASAAGVESRRLGPRSRTKINKALVGLRGDGGTSHDQSRDEGAKESFASAPGVVHELEEAEIQRQLLLRDAPVWPQPGA